MTPIKLSKIPKYSTYGRIANVIQIMLVPIPSKRSPVIVLDISPSNFTLLFTLESAITGLLLTASVKDLPHVEHFIAVRGFVARQKGQRVV
jgi:hypothetical protein